MPKEPIGDKKEEKQKQFAKVELPENLVELKEKDIPKNWLREKFDKWREND